jgi:hypothetical protein
MSPGKLPLALPRVHLRSRRQVNKERTVSIPPETRRLTNVIQSWVAPEAGPSSIRRQKEDTFHHQHNAPPTVVVCGRCSRTRSASWRGTWPER